MSAHRCEKRGKMCCNFCKLFHMTIFVHVWSEKHVFVDELNKGFLGVLISLTGLYTVVTYVSHASCVLTL